MKPLNNKHYALEKLREKTFALNKDKFPPNLSLSDAVNLGLWNTQDGPKEDFMQCIHCGVVIGHWEAHDDVTVEHKKHSPNCKSTKVKNINSDYPSLETYMLFAVWMYQNDDSAAGYAGVHNSLSDKSVQYNVAKDLLRMFVPKCTIEDLNEDELKELYAEVEFIKNNAYLSPDAPYVAIDHQI